GGVGRRTPVSRRHDGLPRDGRLPEDQRRPRHGKASVEACVIIVVLVIAVLFATPSAVFDYNPASDTFAPNATGVVNCGFACHTIVAKNDYIFTAYGKR